MQKGVFMEVLERRLQSISGWSMLRAERKARLGRRSCRTKLLNRLRVETLEERLPLAATDPLELGLVATIEQNNRMSADVNGDGVASGFDALLIANAINSQSSTGVYLDVDGDGVLSSGDFEAAIDYVSSAMQDAGQPPAPELSFGEMVFVQELVPGGFMYRWDEMDHPGQQSVLETLPIENPEIAEGEFGIIHNPGGTFNIVIHEKSGLSGNSAASAAFERAAVFWEGHFSDPITVNIDAELNTTTVDGNAFS